MQNYNPQPVSAQPRIGDWLSETFNLFGQQAGVWCLQGFLFLVIAVGAAIALVVLTGIVVAMVAGSTAGNGGAAALAVIAIWGVAMLVVLAVIVALTAYLHAGMALTAAKQLRGEPIGVGDLFSGGGVFGALFVGMLLKTISVIIGSYACLIPGLLLGGLFSMSTPIAVEEGLSGTQSLGRSWSVTKPHMWEYVLWQFVLGLIGQAGLLLFGIGFPLFVIGEMLAYRDAVGLPGALPGRGGQMMVQQQQFPQRDYGAAGAPMAGYACPRCHRQVAVGAVACPFCEARLA